MLRIDKNARFESEEVNEGGFFTRRFRYVYRFRTRNGWTISALEKDEYERLLRDQERTPELVMHDEKGTRKWWMFQGRFYVDDEGYSGEDIRVLVLDREAKRKRKVENARRRLEQKSAAPTARREPIPEDVRTFVWRRDQGRCVKCGSQENLEFDHIIPVSKGGSNTARNIQILCQKCNREKGSKIA